MSGGIENKTSPVVSFFVDNAMTLLIISVVMGILLFLLPKTQEMTDQVGKTVDSMLETKYTQYDGEDISGSNVLNLIKQSYADSEELYICVKTKANTSGVFYSCDNTATKLPDATQKTLVKDATTKSSNNYITPTAKFLGTVDRNQNGAIIGITFEQQ